MFAPSNTCVENYTFFKVYGEIWGLWGNLTKKIALHVPEVICEEMCKFHIFPISDPWQVQRCKSFTQVV